MAEAKRTRNYASILYPESAPADWREVLQSHCVKAFVSPLHDKDINPDNTPKKPHYHVVLAFNSVKTKAQAQAIFDSFGAINCTPINDLVAYCRYLVHLDNPEKYQYDPNDVQSFCGGDWSSVIRTAADRYKALSDICDFIVQHQILSYSFLIDDLRESNFEWFKVATDNTIFLKEYLKSRDWTNERLRNGYSAGVQRGNRDGWHRHDNDLPYPEIR